MYDRITVPIDGSECSDVAAEAAVELADHFGAAVSVVAVLDPSDLSLGESPPENPTPEDLDDAWRDSLDRAESRATYTRVPYSTTVEVGKPHREIQAHAEAVDADLVAIGTHGRTGLERFLLGSVTERVLRSLDRPILALPGTETASGIDDVVVPTDGSPGSERAAAHACAIATRYDATVHGLSVVNTNALAAIGDAGGAVQEVLRAMEAKCEAHVETVSEQADAHGLAHTTAVIEGSPKPVISEYAAENADLVAMGTHGRSGADRLLLGSVTEHTIRDSDVPILATPIHD